MAIELGKVGALSSGALNGKSLKEAWLNGNKVWPSITPRNYWFTLMPFPTDLTLYFEFRINVYGSEGATLYDTGILNGVEWVGTRIFTLSLTDDYVKSIVVELTQYGSETILPHISGMYSWLDMQSSQNKIAAGYYFSSGNVYMSGAVADEDGSWDQFTEPGGTTRDINVLINAVSLDQVGLNQYEVWQAMSPAPGFTEQKWT